MNYKQIETSRELRLWLGQIVIPAAVVVATVPEFRAKAVEKFKDAKAKISRGKFYVVNKSKERAE